MNDMTIELNDANMGAREQTTPDESDEATAAPVATPCEESDTGRSRRRGSLSKSNGGFERTPKGRCENG
jgi:hypothetical protein